MSSNQVAAALSAIPAFAMPEAELYQVLESSLYPGAKPQSIALVVNYCRASLLDPLQKPVHIVPMRVKRPGGGRDDYEWRDVVMPGIGLYRVQAARTGAHAGTSEPEFGPTRTLEVGEFRLEYPEWCRVTVRRRLPSGEVVEFSAVEYWLENYATKGRDSKAPNEMWQRRTRGQLAKCAEAQALRKAFPELGSQPTADEVEGREIVIGEGATVVDDDKPRGPAMPQSRREAAKAAAVDVAPAEVIDANTGEVIRQPAAAPMPAAAAPSGDDPLVGDGEKAYLRTKAKASGADLAALAGSIGLPESLEGLTKSGFATLKAKVSK